MSGASVISSSDASIAPTLRTVGRFTMNWSHCKDNNTGRPHHMQHRSSRHVILILILSTPTLWLYIIKVSGRLFYFIVTIEVSNPTFKTFIVTIEVSDPILRHSFSSLYLMYLIRLSKFSRYVRWWGRREKRGAVGAIFGQWGKNVQ